MSGGSGPSSDEREGHSAVTEQESPQGTGTTDEVATARLPQGRGRRLLLLARRHRLFLFCALLGLALRLVVVLAYRPALWFHGDSFSFLERGVHLRTDSVRPMGYGLLLRALEPLPHNLSVLTALQHTLGLSIAAMLYALLVRLTVPRWVAVLASLPVLLDGYQLQLEHLVMSDVLYAFLTTVGVVVLLWNERPSARRAAGAGVLLGVAAVTRSIGLPVAAALLVVLVLRRVGLRAVAAAGLACFLPVAAYGAWFHAEQSRWALTNSNGIFLYSRVMAFADCSRLELIPAERALCDPRPPQERPESSRYLWRDSLPLGRLPGYTFTPEKDRLAQGFAVKAIRSQPLDYARQVARELSYNFSTSRVLLFADRKYEFVSDASKVVPRHARQRHLRTVQAYDPSVSSLDTASDPRLTRLLNRYQDVVRVPGPALAVLVVLALAAVVPVRPRTIRGPALTLSAAAGALLVVPPMTAQFDHRYVLAAVPLLAAAAGLSATGIARAAGGGGRHSWGDGEQGLSA